MKTQVEVFWVVTSFCVAVGYVSEDLTASIFRVKTEAATVASYHIRTRRNNPDAFSPPYRMARYVFTNNVWSSSLTPVRL